MALKNAQQYKDSLSNWKNMSISLKDWQESKRICLTQSSRKNNFPGRGLGAGQNCSNVGATLSKVEGWSPDFSCRGSKF